MRKFTALRFIPLLFLAAILAAPAAETPPEEVLLHISIRSPMHLVEAVDAAAGTAAEGTRYALPPGIIPMLFQVYNPFPLQGWDLEKSVDVVILGDESVRDVAVLVHAESAETLAQSLAAEGAEVGMDGDSGYYTADIGEIGELYFTDADAGRTIFSETPETVAEVLAMLPDWTPEHRDEGVVAWTANLPKDWADDAFGRIRRAVDEIAAMRQKRSPADLAEIEKSGVDPEMAYAFLGLVEKYLPRVLDELAEMKSVRGALRLDGERVGLSTSPVFPADARASAVARLAQKSGNADSPMLRYANFDAASVALTAPVEAFLPNAYGVFRDMTKAFYGAVLPEEPRRGLDLVDGLKAAGVGEGVSAGYLIPGGQYSANWLRADDPEKILAIQAEFTASMNALLAKTIVDPSRRFSLSSENRVLPNGVAYVKTVLKPERPEALESLFEALETAGAPDAKMLRQILDFTQLTAAKDGTLVIVTGSVGEDELLAALEAMDAAGDAIVEDEAAEKTLADLRNRQIFFALGDFDAILLYMGAEAAKVYDAAMPTGDFLETLYRAMPDFVASDEIVGFALGAVDDAPVMDISVPLEAINAAIRNYEHYVRVLSAESEEHEHDEDCEHEEGEEGFDGPIGAS